jgi:hypothetical protein
VIGIDEDPPTLEEELEAGVLSDEQYLEHKALLDHWRTLPPGQRRGFILLDEARRDPRFKRILAEHRGAYRAAPVPRNTRRRGAGRRAVRGASKRSSAKSGDSGEDGEPPPARACLGCGRDISDRRADAKTCGATCRQKLKRHGPTVVVMPSRRVWCPGDHAQLVEHDEDGVRCVTCGHAVVENEAVAA